MYERMIRNLIMKMCKSQHLRMTLGSKHVVEHKLIYYSCFDGELVLYL
jgi:hypothetical protein